MAAPTVPAVRPSRSAREKGVGVWFCARLRAQFESTCGVLTRAVLAKPPALAPRTPCYQRSVHQAGTPAAAAGIAETKIGFVSPDSKCSYPHLFLRQPGLLIRRRALAVRGTLGLLPEHKTRCLMQCCFRSSVPSRTSENEDISSQQRRKEKALTHRSLLWHTSTCPAFHSWALSDVIPSPTKIIMTCDVVNAVKTQKWIANFSCLKKWRKRSLSKRCTLLPFHTTRMSMSQHTYIWSALLSSYPITVHRKASQTRDLNGCCSRRWSVHVKRIEDCSVDS